MPSYLILSTPPVLALASLWEMSSDHAFELMGAALLYVLSGLLYRRAAKPLSRQTRVGFLFMVAGATVFVAVIGFTWLAPTPSQKDIVAWVVFVGVVMWVGIGMGLIGLSLIRPAVQRR